MVRISRKTGIIVLNILLIILLSQAISGCSNSSKTSNPNPDSSTPPEQKENVVITIGNLTDLTGPSSNGVAPINEAFNDLVNYSNREGLIPGVNLKIISYDGQLDPSRDIPGYEWLRAKGADLIYTAVPPSAVTLSGRVNRDKFMLFSPSVPLNELSPPGYVFDIGNVPEHDAYTLLKWIAENDWDYENNGPAKIGGAGWTDSYNIEFLDAMKNYAETHPEQFEFTRGFAKEFTFLWAAEVEALKDVDYVFPPSVPTSFIEQYHNAGHDAKFICAETQAAFLGVIDSADLWDELDGALFIRTSRWWTEHGPMIDFTNMVLEESHSPEKAESIRKAGNGYISLGSSLYVIIDIISTAAKTIGPENIDSQALYNAAEIYSQNVDGLELFNFNDTKRYVNNYLRVYRLDGDLKDLLLTSREWLPIVTEP